MIVVPVFITNCQVSENPKTGPVNAQIIIITTAVMDAIGLPVAFVILPAILLKSLADFNFAGLIDFFSFIINHFR